MEEENRRAVAAGDGRRAVSAVAFAQEDGGGQGEGKVGLEGTGAIWACGTGSADLDVVHGAVRIRLSGDITIIGPADLDVRINGQRGVMTEGGDTVVVLNDFDGTVGVRGDDYTIDADGDIALRGRGTGSAVLTGDGRWKTLHNRGVWTGTRLELSA